MLMINIYTWQAWPSIRHCRLCTLPVSGCKPTMIGLMVSSAYCLTYGRRSIESPGTCRTSSISAVRDGRSEKMLGNERAFREG